MHESYPTCVIVPRCMSSVTMVIFTKYCSFILTYGDIRTGAGAAYLQTAVPVICAALRARMHPARLPLTGRYVWTTAVLIKDGSWEQNMAVMDFFGEQTETRGRVCSGCTRWGPPGSSVSAMLCQVTARPIGGLHAETYTNVTHTRLDWWKLPVYAQLFNM